MLKQDLFFNVVLASVQWFFYTAVLFGWPNFLTFFSRFWCFQAIIIINIIFAKVGLGNVEKYHCYH